MRMDPKSSYSYSAPGSSFSGVAPTQPAGSLSYHMPGTSEFPRIDDHLVVPETREEMVRGERMLALPSLPEHGDGHSTLHAVISHHLVTGYTPSIDLLTRFGEGSDFASDVCIRRAGEDAQGNRHLEEVAFEVVSTQTRRHMTIRAEEMTRRGVRRVIAIFTDDHTIEEWLADERRWQPLDPEATLDDPTFVRPLLVRALLDTALGLDEVVKAAEAKGTPRTRAIREEGRRLGKREGQREGKLEGQLAGKRELIESFCALRSIPISPTQQRTLLELDAPGLDALFRDLVTLECWPSFLDPLGGS